MQRFEFMVVPAPRRGEKARGVKTTEDRFALALTHLMNAMGADGWDYVRADTLPCDERVGFTGTKTSFLNMLVFRRAVFELDAAEPPAPRVDWETPAEPAPPRLGPAALPMPDKAPTIGPATPPAPAPVVAEDDAESAAPVTDPPPPPPEADTPPKPSLTLNPQG